MSKRALITGIAGQDAAYLAQLLLTKGYQVYGLGRSLSREKLWRLQELEISSAVELIEGDLTDPHFILSVFQSLKPDECYNLAAISFVGLSWKVPKATLEVNGAAVVNLLEAMRLVSPTTRLYQPGSSEMFGRAAVAPQTEATRFAPCNPYGAAKLLAFSLVDIYRQAYHLYGANAICYNHESPLRGLEYVTRKISAGVAKIAAGKPDKIHLGNLAAERDWGYAGDFVEAMWRMLQAAKPGDYVLATGTTHTIREFLDIAFKTVGRNDWQAYVVEDPKFFRPLEPFQLRGDASRAKRELGWEPKLSFEHLVANMVTADQRRLRDNKIA